MKRLAVAGIVLIALLVGGAQAAGELTLTVVSQTSSTITLGWTPQAGYGYLFSVNGSLVSRTNDASRSSVKFSKVTNGVYEVAVIVKGATGVYPTAQPPPPKNQCEDSVDNDGDGKIDYPADPGCTSATDNDETDPPPPPPPTGFPDASNTGVPAGTNLTAYTGPSNITTAGTVIDGKTIGCITLHAANITIRNSRVRCNAFYALENNSTGLVIQDTEVDCLASNSTGIGGGNLTARRVNVHGCENGFSVNDNATVEDSYIHDLYNGGGSHLDGIQFDPFVSIDNVTIRHNTIYGMDPQGQFGTSAIIDHSFNANSNILIDNNLMAGGAYTLYCSIGFTGTNYRVTNNKFSTKFKSTVGFYGPATECGDQVQSGNVIYETGAPLHLP